MKHNLSGIILPGGGRRKWDYFRLARFAIRLVLEGKVDTPIFGICMGMQLSMLEATEMEFNEEGYILERIPGNEHVALKMEISEDSLARGDLYSDMSQRLIHNLATQNITMHSHKYSVTVKKFKDYQRYFEDLKNFKILSKTSHNQDQQTFGDIITSFQHKSKPIYGVQFHPEKISFGFPAKKENWNPESIHTKEAVEVAQYISNFFVQKCRENWKVEYDFSEVGRAKLARNVVNVMTPYDSKLGKYHSSLYMVNSKGELLYGS